MNTQRANTGRDANGFKQGRLSRFLSSLNTEHPSTPLRAGRTLNTLFALLTLLLAAGAPRAEARPWTPADLPSTTNALWLDAADATTILRSGLSVTNWLDKSGNNRTFAQTVASNQPAYTPGGLNGLSVLSFTNSYLTSTNDRSTWSFLHDGTKVSMFSIVKVWTNATATNNTGGWPLWGTVNASANTGSYVYVDDRWNNNPGRTNNMLHVVFGGTAQTSVSNVKNHTWTIGQYRLLSLCSDPGNSTALNRSIIYRNGTKVSQENVVTNAPKTGSPAYTLNIGALGNALAHNPLVGAFAEIVFLKDTISDEDRLNMEGYLAHKWGMQDQLPANHKYKTTAPTVKDKGTVIMMR